MMWRCVQRVRHPDGFHPPLQSAVLLVATVRQRKFLISTSGMFGIPSGCLKCIALSALNYSVAIKFAGPMAQG
jgi:hypothetical protein